jgi:Protein of unknown function C-terminus (DUF2399)/Protein of unknown function (DUF2397)
MGELVAVKRRFVVHLRSKDLVEAGSHAHVSGDTLVDALGQLVEWGNLRADPDTSRVTTVEDFHRARFLYQLTHAGEVAERALAQTGASLVHHGDFDWGGVRIGNVLHARLPVASWRFDAEEYRWAAASAPSSQALSGVPVAASWDPCLSEAMRRAGRRIEEELVLDGLLVDLAV